MAVKPRRRPERAAFHGMALAALALSAGCGPPAVEVSACDVRQTGCQQRLLQGVESMRGRLWDPWSRPPKMDVITSDRQQLLAEAVARDLRRAIDANFWSPVLRSAGLIRELDVISADQLWFASAAAVYWPRSKTVTIVDRGRPLNDVPTTGILVHELVHAFQDRELDFQTFSPLTTEQEMVRSALTEGEASLYQQLAVLQMEGADPGQFAWEDHFRVWMRSLREVTAFEPSPHTHVRLSFVYPAGGAFLSRAWRQYGITGVNRAFRQHPRTFVELLLSLEGRPPAQALHPADCSPPGGLPYRSVQADDTLGAGLFYAHLVGVFGLEPEAWETALLSRGDRMWVLTDGLGPAGMFWRIRVPNVRASPLGPQLEARTDPPVLQGDDVLFWSGGSRPLIERFKTDSSCREN
jgi:hypothetical protein